MFLHADSEDSDQTGPMPRLIWVFAGRKGHFVMRRLSFFDEDDRLVSKYSIFPHVYMPYNQREKMDTSLLVTDFSLHKTRLYGWLYWQSKM